MKVLDLAAHPENPRVITDEKLAMLSESLKEFGDLSGIVFNRKTNRLSGGHQRVKNIPAETEIVIEQEFKTPTLTGSVGHGYLMYEGERFAVRIVEWNEQREKAANLAANKHSGEWDFQILNEWIKELHHDNFNMRLTGFDSDEINRFVNPVTQALAEGSTELDENDFKTFSNECPKCGFGFDT